MPLILKAMGKDTEMTDLNIWDVVSDSKIKLQNSMVLNMNTFTLIWILVAFKRNINTVKLVCGVELRPEQLDEGI